MNEKTRCKEFVIPLRGNRTFLAMRYLLIFLFAFHLNGFSGIKAQQIAEYQVENANLKTCIKKVEQLTGKGFLYNGNDLECVGNVSLHLENVSLGDLLTSILQGSGYTYELMNGVIAIVRLKEEGRQTVEQELLKGVVRDTRGNVLPGVTVLIKGTTSGVVTDTAGRFTLPVMNRKSVILVFSFVGMKSQEVAVSDVRKEVRVVMEENVDELEEVVITGYGTTTKRRATGSVAVLGREELENRIPVSVDNLLQGLVAGVAVTANSGRPGSSAKVRIRGTNTITGNAEPLWVIDGVPVQDELPEISLDQVKSENFNEIFVNGVAGINPNDIESITVLKDASATAIYGTRAANGVIVVTTKKGRSGKARLSYNHTSKLTRRPRYSDRDINLMNSQERVRFGKELTDMHYIFPEGMVMVGYEGAFYRLQTGSSNYEQFMNEVKFYEKVNTDWFDVLTRDAYSHGHNISISGGSDDMRYYTSIGYDRENGVSKTTYTERYTALINLNTELFGKLRLGFQLNGNIQKKNHLMESINTMDYAYNTTRALPCYNEDGSLFFYENRYYSHANHPGKKYRFNIKRN